MRSLYVGRCEARSCLNFVKAHEVAEIFGQLHIFCVHCGLLAFERKAQLKKMVAIIRQCVADDEPMIIAGDFNDWNGALHRELTRLHPFKEAYRETYHHLAKTFPARLPLFAMDRIYYRNLGLLDAEVLSGAPWERLSDHRALSAIFRLE